MKRKLLAVMAMTACLALVFSGCGAASNDTGSTDVSSEVSTEEIAMGIIGEKTDAEGTFVVELLNSTGQDIAEFSIVENGSDEAIENMLPENEVFTNGEKRALYFTPAAEEAADENADPNEPVLDPQYDAVMKFADGTEATMHAFPFGDMEAGTLNMEEGIVFVIYTSAETGEEVNTLEAEKAAIEQAKAAEEAAKAAEEAAKAAAEKQAESEQSKPSNNSNGSGSSSNNSSGGQNNNNSSGGNTSGGDNGNSGGGGNTSGGNEGTSGGNEGTSGGGEGGCIGDEGLVY